MLKPVEQNALRGKFTECKRTFQDIAEVLDIDDRSVSNKIRGFNAFTQPEMVALAEYLNMTDNEILRIFFNR